MSDERFAISDEDWRRVRTLLEECSRLKTYTVWAANKNSVRQILQAIIQSMTGEIGVIHVTGPDDPECRISFQRIIDPDPAVEEAFDLLYRALATSDYVESCDPPPK
jgi:hypothetical protein